MSFEQIIWGQNHWKFSLKEPGQNQHFLPKQGDNGFSNLPCTNLHFNEKEEQKPPGPLAQATLNHYVSNFALYENMLILQLTSTASIRITY